PKFRRVSGAEGCRGNPQAYLDLYGAERCRRVKKKSLSLCVVQSGAQGCRRNPQAYLDLYGAEWYRRVQKESASLFGLVWCRAVQKDEEGIRQLMCGAEWCTRVQKESVSLFVVQSGAQGCRRTPQAYLNFYDAERCRRHSKVAQL
ncbi:hypothetical protein F5876DRAFT_69946, partial [Lentinula aff. lateritia]